MPGLTTPTPAIEVMQLPPLTKLIHNRKRGQMFGIFGHAIEQTK